MLDIRQIFIGEKAKFCLEWIFFFLYSLGAKNTRQNKKENRQIALFRALCQRTTTIECTTNGLTLDLGAHDGQNVMEIA
jgi:hypothetical protein